MMHWRACRRTLLASERPPMVPVSDRMSERRAVCRYHQQPRRSLCRAPRRARCALYAIESTGAPDWLQAVRGSCRRITRRMGDQAATQRAQDRVFARPRLIYWDLAIRSPVQRENGNASWPSTPISRPFPRNGPSAVRSNVLAHARNARRWSHRSRAGTHGARRYLFSVVLDRDQGTGATEGYDFLVMNHARRLSGYQPTRRHECLGKDARMSSLFEQAVGEYLATAL